ASTAPPADSFFSTDPVPARQQSLDLMAPGIPAPSQPVPLARDGLRLGEPRPGLVSTPPRATAAVNAFDTRSKLLPGLAREVIWELEVATGTYRWGETLFSVLGWSPEEA